MCNFITRSNASVKQAVYRSEETRWKLSSLRGLTGINERITRCMAGKLWLEIAESWNRDPSLSCYLFGSNARMCREPRHMGITTSLPAATEINCHGRRANLFPWTGVYHVYWLPRAITADRVYVPWPVLFRISQNWIRQPVERERADERTVRRECPRPECGFIYSYLSTRCSVEIDRAKPPPIVAIRRDYRCV